MSYINVTTKMFFDRPGVIAAMSDKSRRVLSATGAFARQAMRRGMRKRKGVSEPGGYPSSHSNPLLRNLLYFGYEPGNQSVVVGPTLLSRDKSMISGGKTVPQLINEGGVIVRRVFDRGTGRREAGFRTRRQTYRARPFIALTTPIAAKKLAENMAKFKLKKGA